MVCTACSALTSKLPASGGSVSLDELFCPAHLAKLLSK